MTSCLSCTTLFMSCIGAFLSHMTLSKSSFCHAWPGFCHARNCPCNARPHFCHARLVCIAPQFASGLQVRACFYMCGVRACACVCACMSVHSACARGGKFSGRTDWCIELSLNLYRFVYCTVIFFSFPNLNKQS